MHFSTLHDSSHSPSPIHSGRHPSAHANVADLAAPALTVVDAPAPDAPARWVAPSIAQSLPSHLHSALKHASSHDLSSIQAAGQPGAHSAAEGEMRQSPPSYVHALVLHLVSHTPSLRSKAAQPGAQCSWAIVSGEAMLYTISLYSVDSYPETVMYRWHGSNWQKSSEERRMRSSSTPTSSITHVAFDMDGYGPMKLSSKSASP
mmetsp:Transcript_23693/g.60993  ORF Transcript_23693/g.60993 Transcript_23693/m.60993 type:complete len:204 (-) Transcript_23693:196-807(-)